jgi:hypothetical protein
MSNETGLAGGARAGFALLNAMLLASVLTLTLIAGISYTQASYKSGRKIKYEAQVYNVARAGLVDAIAWFKRQKEQPVLAFTPTYRADNPIKGDTLDPSAINPGLETGMPHLGLVQEFEIDKEAGLWGRYEVGKITKLTKDSQGKLRTYSIREFDTTAKKWVDRTIEGAGSDKYEGVQDLTEDYGLQGKGLLWRIRSHGYVYRKDPKATADTHFYQYPNEVLDQVTLETEIFRLQIRDYGAAIVGNHGPDIKIHATGGLSGGDGYALLWNTGTPNPAAPTNLMTSNVEVYHSTQQAKEPANALDWFEIFGVADAATIASLADVNSDTHRDTGAAMALTYIKPKDGLLQFRDYRSDTPENPGNKPVSGGGILVVDGNMLVNNWNTNVFNGVIYVTGDLTVMSLTNFAGQFIVKGKIDWRPTDIEYNPAILQTIRMKLCQYRERRSALRVMAEE